MRRCFVFSAADFDGLRESPRDGDLIIAADAGYLVCRRAGLSPDLLIGDFDSMEEPSDAAHVERAPVMKDDTDTLLALKAGLSRSCAEFHIYGGAGGPRMDHTIANLQSLLYLRRHRARGWLYENNFVWTVIENETLEVKRVVEDGLLSVFALMDRVEGVTLRGVRYPLDNAVLTTDFPVGVSNHIVDETAALSVKKGALLLGWELPPLVSRTAGG